ncbi:MAG: reverse transcriptase domain-containing protein [Elusimicrobiota bacterium]
MENSVFSKITEFKNILLAAKLAQRRKREHLSVCKFNFYLENELLKLKEEIMSGTYKPGSYHHFTIYEPKIRDIGVSLYRDRVVHHILCNVLEPIIDRRFIYDSYACRKNKGTHKALDRCEKFMKRICRINFASAYILQCDIKKFFPSIDRDIMYKLCRKHIEDENILQLIKLIINANDNKQTGLPIGNLTSQFFANIYLNELDHHIKHNLRQKYYLRYMDDFLIFGNDKKRLWEVRESINKFLAEKLKLELHPKKSTVYPVKCGVSFLGWRLLPGEVVIARDEVPKQPCEIATSREIGFRNDIIVSRRLKRKNIVNFVRRINQKSHDGVAMAEIFNSIRCWIAHCEHGDTYNLRKKVFSGLYL